MSTCAKCRYWSELDAQATGREPLQARCLAPAGGAFAGEYVTGRQSCDSFSEGEPIDAPTPRRMPA